MPAGIAAAHELDRQHRGSRSNDRLLGSIAGDRDVAGVDRRDCVAGCEKVKRPKRKKKR